jgi:hypothetical protein
LTVVAAPSPSGAGVITGPAFVVGAVVFGLLVILLAVVLPRRRRSGTAGRQVWNVPARPEPMVGRRRLMASIGKALRAGRPVVVTPAGGRAGLGTTTTMIEFAHRNRGAYDVGWWIVGTDPQLVGDQLAQLAEALGVATATDSVQHASAAALEALRGRDRWLVIIDEAGSAGDLAPFLPAGRGHVLVGSADPGWDARAGVVTVPPFTRDESVELLRARRPGLDADEAGRVAAALGDLPLTVDVAGAGLAVTGMGVVTYLQLLAAGPETPWTVALDRLVADDPAALALLTLVAWLGPEPVPIDLLAAHPHRLPSVLSGVARDRGRLIERAAILGKRALARTDGRDVQVHPVPLAHLLHRTAGERPDGTPWAAWAVRLLRAALPARPEAPVARQTWRGFLPHVLAATDPGRELGGVAIEVGWLLHRGGRYLLARGEPGPARALLEDALALYRRRLGLEHPETHSYARALAADLHALGHDDEARHVLATAGLERPPGG